MRNSSEAEMRGSVISVHQNGPQQVFALLPGSGYLAAEGWHNLLENRPGV